MIQRVQSLLFLLMIIMLAVLMFVPIWSKTSSDNTTVVEMTVFSIQKLADTGNTAQQTVVESKSLWFIPAMAAVLASLVMFTLFNFKNRLLQMKLGIGISLGALALAVTIFLVARQGEEMLEPERIGGSEFGYFIPFIVLLLNMMANRFIRADEKLVRNMDRLR